MAKQDDEISIEQLALVGAMAAIESHTDYVRQLVERFPALREDARKAFIEALLVPTAKVRGAKAKTVEEAQEIEQSRRRPRNGRTTSVKGSAAKRSKTSNGGKAKDTTGAKPGKGTIKTLVVDEAQRLLNAAPNLTKVEVGDRIFNIARAKGIKTTVGSVRQAVYAHAGHLWEKKTKK